jgi:hypothetical protein
MITLNAQEQEQLDQLEVMHAKMKLDPNSEEEREHVRIMGMNGLVEWKTAIAYAEKYGVEPPHWAEEYRQHFGV